MTATLTPPTVPFVIRFAPVDQLPVANQVLILVLALIWGNGAHIRASGGFCFSAGGIYDEGDRPGVRHPLHYGFRSRSKIES